jgi:hypothetical protein
VIAICFDLIVALFWETEGPGMGLEGATGEGCFEKELDTPGLRRQYLRCKCYARATMDRYKDELPDSETEEPEKD